MSETSNEAVPGGEAALSAALPMALHRGEDECPWVDIGDGSRISIVVLLIISLFLASCSNKNHPKKCNGKRGSKVPMGVI